ncbi:uncharacterized protein LOC124898890 isoform X2 [Capsicum annuum]|uniref:uncharacterized protein LOC124898890 isoform X2 n=1 Tax=Capsicum annuum TaxID=4072 RepID=UPI001FB13525|nr:uncharacterized protein LOC124898890 isoform X2 [Capsicum annuum]
MENCNSLDQTAPATPPSKGWRRLRLLIQATAILRAANRTPSEVDLMLANSADEIRPFLNHSEEQVGRDRSGATLGVGVRTPSAELYYI